MVTSRFVDPPFRTVPALISRSERRALRSEARSLYGSSQRRSREGFELVDGWQLLGPVSNAFADGGDQLGSVHQAIATRFAGLIDSEVVPAMSSYLYYEPGDYIALHLDQQRCQYDVLVILDGTPGPLCVHPELTGMPPRALHARAIAGISEPGVLVDLSDGPLVLAGRSTPHHRPPHPGPEILTLAAFCFGPTLDRPGFSRPDDLVGPDRRA
jgi:hypothetical protein